MDSADDTKSTDKKSSHESDDRKKRRPSLFPIRNSAKRKSSMSEPHNLFDPHGSEPDFMNMQRKSNQKEKLTERNSKSESQFQFRTPSQDSNFSSPRTSRSIPKQFMADTPFVPFVHQSLTKMVWETDQVIPEQKDDIQRKQSQTQGQRNCQPIQQVKQNSPVLEENNNCSSVSQSMFCPLTIRSVPEMRADKIDCVPIVKSEQQLTPLQACTTVAISVPPSTTTAAVLQYTQNNTAHQNCHPGSCQPQLQSTVDADYLNINIQPVLKQQSECPTQPHHNASSESEIEHNSYVSKAMQYYQHAMAEKAALHQITQLTSAKQKTLTICHQPNLQHHWHHYQPRLSFSYIDCITVRPIIKSIVQRGEQTLSRNYGQSVIQYIGVRQNKTNNQCQSQNRQMQVGNKVHYEVQSIKKKNYTMQTSIREHFSMISQIYDDKIGIPRIKISEGIQANTSIIQTAQQTQQDDKRLMSIQEQVNYSINHNYGKHTEQQLKDLKKYIKNLYQAKQNQIEQLKNRKSVEVGINTINTNTSSNTNTEDCDSKQNGTPKSSKKSQESRKSVRNFACQYDPKDTGNRPSLKRVSIADTKIIYEIEDSNSTETFQRQQNQKDGRISTRAKSKQKEKQKKSTKQPKQHKQHRQPKHVKMQNRQDAQQKQAENFEPQHQPQQSEQIMQQQVKKSKKKSNKTPNKKKSKH